MPETFAAKSPLDSLSASPNVQESRKLSQESSLADPLSVKKLTELDNLLFPRIQDINAPRSSSAASFTKERSTEAINMERMKNKSTLLSHYFEDGKRKVDYILVYHKVTNVNPKSEESQLIEERTIFEVSGELFKLPPPSINEHCKALALR